MKTAVTAFGPTVAEPVIMTLTDIDLDLPWNHMSNTLLELGVYFCLRF